MSNPDFLDAAQVSFEMGLPFHEFAERMTSADWTLLKALRRIRFIGEDAQDARVGLYRKVQETFEAMREAIKKKRKTPTEVAASVIQVLRSAGKKSKG